MEQAIPALIRFGLGSGGRFLYFWPIAERHSGTTFDNRDRNWVGL